MAFVKNMFLFLAVWVLSIAYIMYTAVPDGVEDGKLFRFVSPLIKLNNFLIMLLPYFGYDHFSLTVKLMEKSPTPKFNDSSVALSWVHFDGVQVLQHLPKNKQQNSASLVYIHGGGYVLGHPKGYRHITGQLSKDLNVPLFSINYRKAPEYTYPTPLEDCLKVVEYLMKNHRQFGIDPDKIAVMGDSAGGHLSIALTLKLIMKKSSHIPKALGLIYPTTQGLSINTPSMVRNRDDLILPRFLISLFRLLHDVGHTKDLAKFNVNAHASLKTRQEYSKKFNLPALSNQGPPDMDSVTADSKMVEQYEHLYTDPIISPLFADATLLARFPPSLFQICSFDILYDDGEMFAQRLQENGVAVDVIQYQSLHGMLSLYPNHKPAKQAFHDLLLFLKKQLK